MKAVLDLVKALKEIQGLDLGNIEKILTLDDLIRNENTVVRGESTLQAEPKTQQAVSTERM